MALTQSTRLPGPSWDEEVVPALRKRLQSESRNLTRRMSAISLSDFDEGVRQPTKRPPSSHRPKLVQQSSNQMTPTPTTRLGGHSNSNQPATKRARTYSSPYASDLPNGTRGKAKPTTDPARSISPRLGDAKPPTRIPKAARLPTATSPNAGSPYVNGHGSAVTPSPELPYQPLSDQRRGFVPASSSASTVDLPSRANHRLVNEAPPFPTSPTMSSGGHGFEEDEERPRASMESEERPFEHWYRGEVSRNGGVGELRVGRRQEMLDIANYGHMIETKKKALANRLPAEDTLRHRKRAGSIGGVTEAVLERDSLYLDDNHANEVGRVLDEHPLTDLEGEASDLNSLSDHYNAGRGGASYAYSPEDDDDAPAGWSSTAGAHEIRSTTPTPATTVQARFPASSPPPTRIPGPSSRRSSDSRSTTNTTPPTTREPSQSTSSSSSKAPINLSPPLAPTPEFPSQSQSMSAPSSSVNGRRGIPPSPKKSRTAASKATRAKTLASKKDMEEEAKRRSVAYYPTPVGDDGEDMKDAIPSWTRPVLREGNWDEVVIPVVARKKGLDGYYENADGGPQPKKVNRTVAPAPGTFGYDHSKYRPPRDNFESIPMDEFGQTEPPQPNTTNEDRKPSIPPPAENLARNRPTPSPAPFSQYPALPVQAHDGPQVQQQAQAQEMEADGDAGCCKCVIM